MIDIPDDIFRREAPATVDELVHAAGYMLSLVQVARGQLHHEADQRLAHLERAVLAGLVRGSIGVWAAEAIDEEPFSSPGRELAWLCARRVVIELGSDLRTARACGLNGVIVGSRRARPWDVVRWVLITSPNLAHLDSDAFRALRWDAEAEIDQAARVSRTDDALDQLLAERRRRATLAQLLPILAALDAGAPAPDTAARLRAAAALFGEDAEPRLMRAAA